MDKVLVTGGCGMTGSYLVDILIKMGKDVTILDSLDKDTHPNGIPKWTNPKAHLIVGDVRDKKDVRKATKGVDMVFHLAAFGGFVPGDEGRYNSVNVDGTGILLDALASGRTCRRVVVSSSQAVYGEGLYRCQSHGLFHPKGPRLLSDMKVKNFERICPICNSRVRMVPITEFQETLGNTSYARSRIMEEEVALAYDGERMGVTVLRYSVIYGPRQSPFNPYTGVVSIFSVRMLQGLPPIIYEDGMQCRDFVYVGDVVRANLLAATHKQTLGQSFNVSTGVGVTMNELVHELSMSLGVEAKPEIRSFRPDDVRNIILNSSQLQALGFRAKTSRRVGMKKFADWFKTQGKFEDRFAAAEEKLRSSGKVVD